MSRRRSSGAELQQAAAELEQVMLGRGGLPRQRDLSFAEPEPAQPKRIRLDDLGREVDSMNAAVAALWWAGRPATDQVVIDGQAMPWAEAIARAIEERGEDASWHRKSFGLPLTGERR